MPEREREEEAPKREEEARSDTEIPTAADSWRRHREIHDVVQAIRKQRHRTAPER